MIDYKQIKSVHLEISTRCNASCPLCPRNTSGYDEDLGYPIHDMTLKEAKKIFTPSFLQQLDNILINGNFGDFITAKDNIDIIEYFKVNNPNLRIEISTNGSGGKKDLWEQLAKFDNIIVGFALDGLEDTHSIYRRNTNWKQVISNALKFIDAGGTAVWRMIKLHHNEHQIEECKRLSSELGFKEFNLLDNGRDSGPVYDKFGNLIYKLGNDPAFTNSSYPDNVHVWKQWSYKGDLTENRINFYKTIPVKNNINCYSKKNREIYITATGEVYPCCWLGFYPKLEYKHPWQRDNMFLKDMILNNNALDIGIEQAIDWFNKIEESWNKKAYTEGRLYKCDEQCGKN